MEKKCAHFVLNFTSLQLTQKGHFSNDRHHLDAQPWHRNPFNLTRGHVETGVATQV
jgi:hypothetical protein